MKSALINIEKKGLGVIVVKDSRNNTNGILTDGDLKRIAQKYKKIYGLELKKVMKKEPLSVEKNTLAAKALSLMNSKRITFLCVHKKNQKNKTIGVIHIHNILENNIQ